MRIGPWTVKVGCVQLRKHGSTISHLFSINLLNLFGTRLVSRTCKLRRGILYLTMSIPGPRGHLIFTRYQMTPCMTPELNIQVVPVRVARTFWFQNSIVMPMTLLAGETCRISEPDTPFVLYYRTARCPGDEWAEWRPRKRGLCPCTYVAQHAILDISQWVCSLEDCSPG